MINANPREMINFDRSDLKRMSLRALVTEEILPYINNTNIQEEIIKNINDQRYELPAKQFKEEIKKDKPLQDLIQLRDEIYQGSWDRMLKDLKDRLTARPYNYKKVNQSAIDFPKVWHLKQYEQAQRIGNQNFNLANLLKEALEEE